MGTLADTHPTRANQEAALSIIEVYDLTLSRVGVVGMSVVLGILVWAPLANGEIPSLWASVGPCRLLLAALTAVLSALLYGALVTGWLAHCALRLGIAGLIGRLRFQQMTGIPFQWFPGPSRVLPGMGSAQFQEDVPATPWGAMPLVAPAHSGPASAVYMVGVALLVAGGGAIAFIVRTGGSPDMVQSASRAAFFFEAWAFAAGPVLGWYFIVSPWVWRRYRLGVPWRTRVGAWSPLCWANQLANMSSALGQRPPARRGDR